jgi:ABC-type uncharacterized transport system permease subunit
MFKPAVILIKANYKQQIKHHKVLFIQIFVPMMYTIVFVAQILINYHINPHAFAKLPIALYFTVLFALQMVVFLSMERSLRFLAQSALNSDLDYTLLRPINLSYYKYFRIFDIQAPVMLTFYFIAFSISAYYAQISLTLVGQILSFVLLGSIIKLNLRAAVRGLVFHARDILQTTRLEESLDYLVINKPPEVFPSFIKFILTFILPYMLFHNYLFDIVRAFSDSKLWLLLAFWVVLSGIINSSVWSLGLRKYESMG